MKCQYCPSTMFRRSRMRAADFMRIFLLELPVRCMRCRQRQSGPFLLSAISLSSESRKRHEHSHAEGEGHHRRHRSSRSS